MSALRRISTRRFSPICALTVVAAIGVTADRDGDGGRRAEAAAEAARQRGPRRAERARGPPGISARVKFTNNLVDASSIQGTDPLIAGAQRSPLGLAEGGGKLRLELQSEGAAAATPRCWSPTTASRSTTAARKPSTRARCPKKKARAEQGAGPGPRRRSKRRSPKAEKHAELSGATPSDVAGQPTYTLRVAPKHDGGLLGGVELAWDADNGDPAAGGDLLQRLELAGARSCEATDVSLRIGPCLDLRNLAAGRAPRSSTSARRRRRRAPTRRAEPAVEGLAAVQRSVDFPLDRPRSLAGLPRAEVSGDRSRRQDRGPRHLRQGPRRHRRDRVASEPGAERRRRIAGGLSLPKVSINGAQGEELDTALGTVLRFSRGGVDYIVARLGPPGRRRGRGEGALSGDANAAPVEVRGLCKRYGDLIAVDDVDLTVEAGDVFGYLGPERRRQDDLAADDAGADPPDRGHASASSAAIPRPRSRRSRASPASSKRPRFYPYLSGRTNLELLAALDGDGAKARIEEALEIVGLADRAKDRVGAYSHGMRQRLGIAAALLRGPKLLLLDEPATGLDPGGMRDMRDLIRDLSGPGMTVLLSSHLLGEVEDLCNRVAIVRSGGVAYQGSLADLRREGRRRLPAADQRGRRRPPGRRGAGRDRRSPAPGPRAASPSAPRATTAVGALSLALTESGALIRELSPRHASLEDLFFRLTEGDATRAEPGAAPAVGSAA